MEYTKPWLSLEQHVERLASRGVDMGNRDRAAALLKSVGYYRLTGYLYPFRESDQYVDDEGRTRTRVLSGYRPGTVLHHAESIIDFDRHLRMLVMDGVERIEVAVRMQIGYVLGRTSAFAHEDPACFTEAFTAEATGPDTGPPVPSSHARWLQRVDERRTKSDEQFVDHFREKYDDRMPVWALTELLELVQLSVLCRGLRQPDAEEIAMAFGSPISSRRSRPRRSGTGDSSGCCRRSRRRTCCRSARWGFHNVGSRSTSGVHDRTRPVLPTFCPGKALPETDSARPGFRDPTSGEAPEVGDALRQGDVCDTRALSWAARGTFDSLHPPRLSTMRTWGILLAHLEAQFAVSWGLANLVVRVFGVVRLTSIGDDCPVLQRPNGKCPDEMGEAGPGRGEAIVDLGRHRGVDGTQHEAVTL